MSEGKKKYSKRDVQFFLQLFNSFESPFTISDALVKGGINGGGMEEIVAKRIVAEPKFARKLHALRDEFLDAKFNEEEWRKLVMSKNKTALSTIRELNKTVFDDADLPKPLKSYVSEMVGAYDSAKSSGYKRTSGNISTGATEKVKQTRKKAATVPKGTEPKPGTVAIPGGTEEPPELQINPKSMEEAKQFAVQYALTGKTETQLLDALHTHGFTPENASKVVAVYEGALGNRKTVKEVTTDVVEKKKNESRREVVREVEAAMQGKTEERMKSRLEEQKSKRSEAIALKRDSAGAPIVSLVRPPIARDYNISTVTQTKPVQGTSQAAITTNLFEPSDQGITINEEDYEEEEKKRIPASRLKDGSSVNMSQNSNQPYTLGIPISNPQEYTVEEPEKMDNPAPFKQPQHYEQDGSRDASTSKVNITPQIIDAIATGDRKVRQMYMKEFYAMMINKEFNTRLVEKKPQSQTVAQFYESLRADYGEGLKPDQKNLLDVVIDGNIKAQNDGMDWEGLSVNPQDPAWKKATYKLTEWVHSKVPSERKTIEAVGGATSGLLAFMFSENPVAAAAAEGIGEFAGSYLYNSLHEGINWAYDKMISSANRKDLVAQAEEERNLPLGVTSNLSSVAQQQIAGPTQALPMQIGEDEGQVEERVVSSDAQFGIQSGRIYQGPRAIEEQGYIPTTASLRKSYDEKGQAVGGDGQLEKLGDLLTDDDHFWRGGDITDPYNDPGQLDPDASFEERRLTEQQEEQQLTTSRGNSGRQGDIPEGTNKMGRELAQMLGVRDEEDDMEIKELKEYEPLPPVQPREEQQVAVPRNNPVAQRPAVRPTEEQMEEKYGRPGAPKAPAVFIPREVVEDYEEDEGSQRSERSYWSGVPSERSSRRSGSGGGSGAPSEAGPAEEEAGAAEAKLQGPGPSLPDQPFSNRPMLRAEFATGSAGLVEAINLDQATQIVDRLMWQSMDNYEWEPNQQSNNALYLGMLDEDERRFEYTFPDDPTGSKNQYAKEMIHSTDMDVNIFKVPQQLRQENRFIGYPVSQYEGDPGSKCEGYPKFHDVFLPDWASIPESHPLNQFTAVAGTSFPDSERLQGGKFSNWDSERLEGTNQYIYTTLD